MTLNPVFSMSTEARRAICEAAMARYCPQKVAPIVTYHGDVPFAELKPETRDALVSIIEAAIKAVENGKLPLKQDPRIGEVVQVPYVTRMTIVDRVREFGKDWYVLEATLISRMRLHKLVEAI